MIKRLIALFVLIMTPAVAMACPDWQQAPTESYLSYAGSQLWEARSHSVIAGGSEYIGNNNCGIRNLAGRHEAPVGYVAYAPDFEMEFSASGFQLELSVQADCDATLLVNTGQGNWYFEDDDPNLGYPRICLTSPSSGTYDIWIGTYGSSTCNARLVLESWRGGSCSR